jgi:hypothetical protein
MSIDTTKMGQFVAMAMDQMEEQFPEGRLGEVLIVCEVQHDDRTSIGYVCTDERAFVALGMLNTAALSIEQGD